MLPFLVSEAGLTGDFWSKTMIFVVAENFIIGFSFFFRGGGLFQFLYIVFFILFVTHSALSYSSSSSSSSSSFSSSSSSSSSSSFFKTNHATSLNLYRS